MASRILQSLSILFGLVACGRPASSPPAPVLLQGALSFEIGRLLDSARVTRVDSVGPWTFAHGTIGGYPVVVSRTLMGGTSAAAATAVAIERYHPRAIINTGTAGGHDSTLRVGDIVIGQTTINLAAFKTPPRAARAGSRALEWIPLDLVPRSGDAEGELHEGSVTQLPADRTLLAAAHRAREGVINRRVVDGVIGSSDVWNEELDRIAHFRTQLKTSVEEMETAPAAQVARAFGVPFLGIRVVTANVTNAGAYDVRTADVVQDFVVRIVRVYLQER